MLEESQHWINQGTIWSNNIMRMDQNLLVRYLEEWTSFFSAVWCRKQRDSMVLAPYYPHYNWGFSRASPAEFSEAQKLLHPAIASSVLQHLVISCQPCIRVETEKQRYGSHAEVIEGPTGDDGVPPVVVIRVFFSIWHQSYLGGLEHFLFSIIIYGIILTIDSPLIFQDG